MQTHTDQESTISEITARAINEYIEAQGKSLRQIEYHSSVSFSYIRRLSNREISDEKIDCIKLFQILKLVKNIDFATTVISSNEAWAKKVSMWTGLPSTLMKKSIQSKDIEAIILKEDELIVAFVLGLNVAGVSARELRNIGGDRLLKAAIYLSEEGILTKVDNTFQYAPLVSDNTKFFSFSKEALKRVSLALLKYYDKDHSGQCRNYLSVIHEGFSAEFLKKAQKKIDELRQWLNIECAKAENLGPNPSFIGIFMDTFTDELIHDKTEQQ